MLPPFSCVMFLSVRRCVLLEALCENDAHLLVNTILKNIFLTADGGRRFVLVEMSYFLLSTLLRNTQYSETTVLSLGKHAEVSGLTPEYIACRSEALWMGDIGLCTLACPVGDCAVV